jgi:polar amino acid transport system permease protein
MTEVVTEPNVMYSKLATFRNVLRPHRIVMGGLMLAIVALAIENMQWDWIPRFQAQITAGVVRTIILLVTSVSVGMVLAILLGLAQVAAPIWIRWLARGFCGVIRGTPLLLQIWLLYYGLGSVLVAYPEIRSSFLWPLLRQAWPYGFVALTISFAAYEGEVMRGAFAGVPRGELEAAKAYGMGRLTMFRRIWLPRAIQRSLPTIGSDVIFQMKSTPLVATITVVDVYGAIFKVRQATYLTYEPLLLLALIYVVLTGLIALTFRRLERRIPILNATRSSN